MPAHVPQLLTETEAARLLRISRHAVGEFLEPIRLSVQRKRYLASDVDKLVKRLRHRGQEQDVGAAR